MAASKIDLDRGVMTLRHAASGLYIHMYVDEPGVYYADNGVRVSVEVAKLAGYDIEYFGKQRERRERFAAAQDKINAEMDMADETSAKVLAEAGDFKVLEMPLGNAIVVDTEGSRLTPSPVPKAQAMLVFKSMTTDKK